MAVISGVIAAVLLVIAGVSVLSTVLGNGPDPVTAKADSCGQALAPVSTIVDALQGGAQGQLGPTAAAERLGPAVQQLQAVSQSSRDPRFQQLATDIVASIDSFDQRVFADPQADFAQDGPQMARRVQAMTDYCHGGT